MFMYDELKIIEIDIPDIGIYYPYRIMVNDISKKDVLVHEMTHHLIFIENKKLLSYIEWLDSEGEFTRCFNSLVRDGFFEGYPESDYWEEFIAYYMELLDESELRELDIEEYNMILDNNFKYEKY